MRAFTCTLLAVAALAVGTPPPAQAQDPLLRRVPPRPIPLALRTANRVRFDPATQGFQFSNSFFRNNAFNDFDIRTDGLCGGMIFAVLDYLAHPDVPIPTQDYEPAEGTLLRNYILSRQTTSVADRNFVKWAEYGVNPFGARNSEFWRWGLQDRLDQLKREIDAGRPVPIGLKSCDEGCNGEHVVLAVGYNVGGYRGNPDQNAGDVRITVYDPNYPGQTKELQADVGGGLWRYSRDGRRGDRWRSWFIMHYTPTRPPRINAPAARQLVVTMMTGGDDLRGGNDNLNILVLLPDHRVVRFDNVNNGRRWVNEGEQSVDLPLPDDVRVSDIRGVRLETTSGGGVGGDNWNMDWIWVRVRDGGALRDLFDNIPPDGVAPSMTRFTGEDRSEQFLF